LTQLLAALGLALELLAVDGELGVLAGERAVVAMPGWRMSAGANRGWEVDLAAGVVLNMLSCL
jgi:hypothetical protein